MSKDRTENVAKFNFIQAVSKRVGQVESLLPNCSISDHNAKTTLKPRGLHSRHCHVTIIFDTQSVQKTKLDMKLART